MLIKKAKDFLQKYPIILTPFFIFIFAFINQAFWLKIPFNRSETLFSIGFVAVMSFLLGRALTRINLLFQNCILSLLLALYLDMKIGVNPMLNFVFFGREKLFGFSIGYLVHKSILFRSFTWCCVFLTLWFIILKLCSLFKKNTVIILNTFFGTALFISIIVQITSIQTSTQVSNKSRLNTKLPVIIHVIADAFMSPNAFPKHNTESQITKESITNFQKNFGFRNYGHTFSKFNITQQSISSILNFQKEPSLETISSKIKLLPSGFQLDQNSYFDHLKSVGYQIHVYQNSSFNYCSHTAVTNCKSTSIYNPLDPSLTTIEPWIERTINTFLTLSNINSMFFRVFNRLFSWVIGPNFNFSELSSFVSLNILEKAFQEAFTAPRGTAIFVHILLPHPPYVWDENCQKSQTIISENSDNHYNKEEIEFVAYLKQTRCVIKKLSELMRQSLKSNTFSDTIVLIHGDHGSRITRFEEFLDYKGDPLNQTELANIFSTLFLYKSPNVTPGTDNEFISINRLFSRFFNQNGGTDDQNLSLDTQVNLLDIHSSTPKIIGTFKVKPYFKD